MTAFRRGQRADRGRNRRAADAGVFCHALAGEEITHKLYSRELEDVKEGKGMAETNIFICGVCGNTRLHKPPQACPICNAPQEIFFEVIYPNL
ncbi:MAG: hypothetical protein P9M08_08810 [Candidatus Erginobacter occultus]|nr:hypothetical protein [Candidatus Erginobacter occultus]